MLMVEGDHIATGGEAPHRVRVRVVADCDVMHHGRCRGVRPFREQPHIDTKTDGGGVHHPSKLPTADDAHGEGLLTSHARKRTAHCSLKITERCTMKLTVVATPWAMTNAMI